MKKFRKYIKSTFREKINKIKKEYEEIMSKYPETLDKVHTFIYFMFKTGYPVNQISELFGISRQRVWQIVKKYEEEDYDVYDPTI
jgi:transposase-like protein